MWPILMRWSLLLGLHFLDPPFQMVFSNQNSMLVAASIVKPQVLVTFEILMHRFHSANMNVLRSMVEKIATRFPHIPAVVTG
jgi:hypothetical protein